MSIFAEIFERNKAQRAKAAAPANSKPASTRPTMARVLVNGAPRRSEPEPERFTPAQLEANRRTDAANNARVMKETMAIVAYYRRGEAYLERQRAAERDPQVQAEQFAVSMLSVAARARGETFDPAKMVAAPSQARRVLTSEMVRKYFEAQGRKFVDDAPSQDGFQGDEDY